jgi:hypothetical protein
MEPQELRLFFEPKDRLRLTVGSEKSYHTVKPVWAAPLSHPDTYLALLDGKGQEIITLPDPKALTQDSWAVAQEALRQRYLTATVARVLHTRQEFGATYWSVETDRGPRDFVTQNLQENAIWLSDVHLLLLDVDGNRFEITDTTALDANSRHLIEMVL